MSSDSRSRRAIVIASSTHDRDGSKIGDEDYSYAFVAKAFEPLLASLGDMTRIDRPESRLDYAVRRLCKQGREPVQLSLLPLHSTYFAEKVPTISFPFWEFPDVPNQSFTTSLRGNWVHLANQADLLLTACQFTRDALRRSGVTRPIHVVPVPIERACFDIPAWNGDAATRLETSVHEMPESSRSVRVPDMSDHFAKPPFRLGNWASSVCTRMAKNYFPQRLAIRCRGLKTVWKAANLYRRAVNHAHEALVAPRWPATQGMDLNGIVYTSIFNPQDRRKNVDDLVSAFLIGLGDCADATLVLKLVVPKHESVAVMNELIDKINRMGVEHRCKLVLIPGFLSQEEMLDLMKASTYYVTATRAEGACLPLQNYLAAGRPAISPRHTAMLDYFDESVGFVVASQPEPTSWPIDPEKRLTTTWHRPAWASLVEALKQSYAIAKQHPRQYRDLANNARQQMRRFAHPDVVRPALEAALDSLNQVPKRAAA